MTLPKIPLLPPRDLVLWHSYHPRYRDFYEKFKDVFPPRKLWAAPEEMPRVKFPRSKKGHDAWMKKRSKADQDMHRKWPAIAYPFPPDVARRIPEFFVSELTPPVWGRASEAALVDGHFLRVQIDLSLSWEKDVEPKLRAAFLKWKGIAGDRGSLPKGRARGAPRSVWIVLSTAEKIRSRDAYKIAAMMNPDLYDDRGMVEKRRRLTFTENVKRCIDWARENSLL